ncbi:MAG: DUF3794 domain-containing protein [Oscillospiraceae bacterium]|jgi:hypothetical protein|nr:DUF3794 domain-containing protein [Oscillospiraceae bacterium]
MELTLKKNNISFWAKQADTSTSHEETMEIIVSDSLPDAESVVSADGTAVLRSKEYSNGKITVTGVVRAYAMYNPEGGGAVRGLAVQIPFSASIEAPDVTPLSKLLAGTELTGIDARMLNSRKLLIRAELRVSVSAYGESVLPIALDTDDDCDLEVLTDQAALNPVAEIREKAFSINDELPLPSGKPPIGSVVNSGVKLSYSENKIAGSKLIVKGTANVALTYVPLGSSELQSADFTLPFSEIVDLGDGDDSEAKTFDISIAPTGAYIQENGSESYSGISVEIPAVIQAIVWKKLRQTYISDAYSPTRDAVCSNTEHSISCLDNEQTFKNTVRETLPADANVRSVVCMRVFPGEIVRAADGYGVSFRVCVTYCTDEGKALTVQGGLEAHFDYPGLSEIADIRATATYGEAFAAAVAGGIEVRVPVELHTKVFSTCRLSPVSDVAINDADEQAPVNTPSLVLSRVGFGESLWSLAKRYKSTQTLIRQANGLEESAEVSPGDLLIIARKR